MGVGEILLVFDEFGPKDCGECIIGVRRKVWRRTRECFFFCNERMGLDGEVI